MMEKPTARGYPPIDGIAAYDAAVKGLVFGADPKSSRAAAWPPCKPLAAPAA